MKLMGRLQHWHFLSEDMKKMMHKSGFTEEEMQRYAKEAGLVDYQFVKLSKPVVMVIGGEEVEKELFFARGMRA